MRRVATRGHFYAALLGAFVVAAAGCAVDPEADLAGGVAGKADDPACIGAAVDSHGYCRLPNGRFTFAYCCEPAEEEPACDPEPRRECVFGVGSHASRHLGYLDYHAGGGVTAAGSLGALGEQQVLVAMEAGGWEGITTLEEAFDSIDDDGFYFHDAHDGATGESYTHLQFYAGDTEVGVFFRAGTTEVVANVGDGDIYDCTAFVPVASDDPCADGPTATLAVVHRVLGDNGVGHGQRLSFPEYEVYFQLAWDEVPTFADALDAAIRSFIEDDEDIESPRSLLLDADDDPACPQEDHADRVRCYMSQPDTLLGIVPLDLDGDAPVYPPEHGESVEDHWIFFLSMPGFSDHLFWAVVPVGDIDGVYNYGFN